MLKLTDPLHSLLIPDQYYNSIAINFVRSLPEDEEYNYLITITDCLNSDIYLIPTTTDVTAEELAKLFFQHWYCKNGLSFEIVSDCDKLFISHFWKALYRLTDVKLKLFSSYHLQTDSSSKQSNKTVIQMLCYHIKHN